MRPQWLIKEILAFIYQLNNYGEMSVLEFNINTMTDSTHCCKKKKTTEIAHLCMQMLSNLKYSQRVIQRWKENAFTHTDKNFARSLL